MFVTREDLSYCARVAVLEKINLVDPSYKNYILNEASYEEVLNMAFNPHPRNIVPAELIEKDVMEFVKMVENERVQLLEQNMGRKRLAVSYLKEQYGSKLLTESSVKFIPLKRLNEFNLKSLDPRKWGTEPYIPHSERDKAEAPKEEKPPIKDRIKSGIDSATGAVKDAYNSASGEVKGKYDKASQRVKDIPENIKLGVDAAKVGQSDRDFKDAGGTPEGRISRMATAHPVATGVGAGLGAAGVAAAGLGAYKWAKRRKKNRQAAALQAATTMEAVSEIALKNGNFDLHVEALSEARKWVERAYSL